ncbi:MAG: glycosyltransferase family 2 protein [Anaerolineae bacterium]
MFETVLRGEGQRRLAEIGAADIVIGIPTYKNARTIATIGRTAADALARYFPRWRGVIAIVDGGSSDDTVAMASDFALPAGIRRIVTTYQGMQGKGSAVRAIFEMARSLHAQIVVILEADVQTLTPDWVQRLVQPIRNKEYNLALPYYARPIPDGAVTDLLAFPLTRMLYGVEVRQPMGGEFAISTELATRLTSKDVWETDVARHGFDIWLTTISIVEGVKLCQVPLGTKLDDSREMLLALDPTFIQSVGTLFRMVDIFRKRWPVVGAPRLAPVYGDYVAADIPRKGLPPITTSSLADAFTAGARRYARIWKTVLFPSNREMIKQLVDKPGGAFHFPADLWAHVVFDFAVVYNKGEGDPDKVVAALLPMYYARAATLMKETGSRPDVVEKAIMAQADTFIAHKRYLLERWETYVPWAWDGVR